MRFPSKKKLAENKRLEKRLKPIRISGVDPKYAVCQTCGELKPTTLNSQWSGIDPIGRIVRTCDECVRCCAAG